METIVVNIFGVPGAGKSTGAAYVFAALKQIGVNAELVTEYAKDKVWEENNEAFKNQAFLFGKQSYRMSRCAGKVEVIVTDSPLPLSILYNNDPRLTENFNRTVMDVFNSYQNLNFFLQRTKPYNPSGRLQTEEESNALAEPLRELLASRGIKYIETTGDDAGYDKIVAIVMEGLMSVEQPAIEISAEDALWLRAKICCDRRCGNCPLHSSNNGKDEICGNFMLLYPEEVVNLLVKWGLERRYLEYEGNKVVRV
ncbi:MAG: AAA family ATPase [Clostridia bacterium]|nr:AAA family ATPase [Clostridia bacterium]